MSQTIENILQFASCLINAQPFPAHRPAADDNSLIGCTDDWSLPMPISLTAYAHFAARLGAFFCRTRFIWQQWTIRTNHSDLSDQSALEIRVRIGVRLKVVLFSIFHGE